MSSLRVAIGTLSALACLALAPSGDLRAADEAAPPGRKHALLIGCTVYPELPPRRQLQGPANDVALTSELLRERFGFVDAEVVTLLHANPEARRPTYDNIVREFAELIERVGPGDSVFILLGGHGSQLRNDAPDDPRDQELDGRDEVFLPEDVAPWKFNQPIVKAIRDDQIRAWLDAIRARGGSVFFVADTCHSGTMDRGGPAAEDSDASPYYRTRYVDPALFEPRDGQPVPPPNGEDVGAIGLAELARDPDGELPGLVALYAVDDDTLEAEHPMPPDNSATGPVYGRLSYALNWVLARSNRNRPLIYRELAQQICWRYQAWRWDDVGFIIGSGQEMNRDVLGKGLWKDRSTILLSRHPATGLSINAGLLHGVNVGNVYAVYPPTGFDNDQTIAGYVRITEATPTTARAQSCEFNGAAAVDGSALPAPGRCELAFAAASSLRLTVGVSLRDVGQGTEQLSNVQALVRTIAERPGSLIELAGPDATPEVLVLVGGDGLYLRRPTDVPANPPVPGAAAAQSPAPQSTTGQALAPSAAFPEQAYGPFPADASPESALAQALETMAKALNIRELAESDGEMIVGLADDPAVTLEVTVERWNSSTETFEPVDPTRPLEVQDDQRLQVSVRNAGGSPVDVTILYFDSAFGITSFFPTLEETEIGGFDNRLKPRGKPAVVPFTINDCTVGLEDVVIIATLPQPGAGPQNFARLQQAGVERGASADSAMNTPAGRLLASAAAGSGQRGGTMAEDIAQFALRRISWVVRPRVEPPNPTAP
ncbi:MAG TPA: caspase family protein [Lacipirellulaceae bacterium]|nr:caspase family protein [Lacipirellulaceae bacterium]